MSLNISLPPQLEELIKKKVESGRYASASEVVREALRRMETADQRREEEHEELRKKIQAAYESGPPIPAEEVFATLGKKYKERAEAWKKRK